MFKEDKIPVFILSGKSPVSASGGGYSTYAYNLARVIKKLGHPVYIVALGNENREKNTEVGKILLFKTKLPLLNVNIYALPGLPLYSIIFAKGIKKIIDKKRYVKIIVWGIGPWGLTAFILKLIFKNRVIHLNNYFTTVRHEWQGGVKALKIKDYGILLKLKYTAIYLTAVQYLAQLEKMVLKSANVIITSYESTENILKNEFGVHPGKFFRANFYVQVYKRKSQEITKKGKINKFVSREIKIPKKYILFLSRQDPRKGVNFLLHAMKILMDKGYKVPLLIAGGGDMLSPNKVLAKKLKISKFVKFLGFVNDPKPLMKSCTVFVFPSIEEGAGALTINEAMEMGLPIVSTACDGIVEDLENEKTALLVDKENPNQLADAITKLLDNPWLARRLAQAARKEYLKKFTFENMRLDIKRLIGRL